jgi:two-component system sensor histidine kinase KdpD
MFACAISLWKSLSPKTRRTLVGLAAGAAMAIACAFIANALDIYLHVRAPSMTFMSAVILAAIWYGRRVALVTALFAFFVYNFYLAEPRYTFAFAGLEDGLTLLVFVGAALLIGGLAGNLHDQRERAQEQVRLFSGLFTVSRAMAESGQPDEAMRLLAAGVCEVAAREAVILQADDFEVLVQAHAEPATALAPATTRAAAARLFADPLNQGGPDLEEVAGWRLQLVQGGGKPAAVLAWKPSPNARGAEHAIAVRLLCELTHVAIERAQFMQRQLEMDTMAATERLRSALMSSISHDFRTPLSTILTSASSLQAYGDQFSPATRTDLLTSIQEEAERLNRFIRNILDMTRVDAGALKLREEWIDPLEIIENIAERMQKRLGDRTLAVNAPAAVPSIFVDPLLLEQAMINVIENALVHTPAGSAIRIGADYSTESVRLWIEDEGPGVPGAELPLIFDKFHRLESTQNTQGAGLGLAISKGFVEAMRGEIRAMSPAQHERGLRIEFVFPLQTELANA